jgi:hypothetical protein
MKPGSRRRAGLVKGSVRVLFDSLETAFGGVLMLVIRLALIVVDGVVPQDVQHFVAYFRFGTIADKPTHCFPLANIVLQRGDNSPSDLMP